MMPRTSADLGPSASGEAAQESVDRPHLVRQFRTWIIAKRQAFWPGGLLVGLTVVAVLSAPVTPTATCRYQIIETSPSAAPDRAFAGRIDRMLVGRDRVSHLDVAQLESPIMATRDGGTSICVAIEFPSRVAEDVPNLQSAILPCRGNHSNTVAGGVECVYPAWHYRKGRPIYFVELRLAPTGETIVLEHSGQALIVFPQRPVGGVLWPQTEHWVMSFACVNPMSSANGHE